VWVSKLWQENEDTEMKKKAEEGGWESWEKWAGVEE
jgi:hypothetical protein